MGDASLLFKWLPLFEGHARRIYIVPETADSRLTDLILKTGDVDFLICDKPPRQGVGNQCTILTQDEAIGEGLSSEDDVKPRSAFTSELVLATSGTTSTPKLVAHTLHSLTHSMKIDERFAHFRWGLMYDPARFAGLQVLLQSMLNGAMLLAPQWELGLTEQIRWLAGNGCDAMSATPSLWRKILMTEHVGRLALRQITLGGEIADPTIMGALSNRFPKARLSHVYASTEAGVGFSVHDGQPGFPEHWLESSKNRMRMKIGDNGCLWVAPETIAQKYLGSEYELVRSDGWIDTGDVVRVEQGRVTFCGRLNGSINVGGNKVYPEELETTVLEVAGVSAALARGRANSIMGNLVEVLVVRGDDAPADLTSRIKAHCRKKLDSYKVPAFICIVDDIDVSSAGKMLRGS